MSSDTRRHAARAPRKAGGAVRVGFAGMKRGNDSTTAVGLDKERTMAIRKQTRKDTRKVFAIKIRANTDNSGNPRRGWLVYTRDGAYLGFVDEGYGGRRALTSLFPNALELASISVQPKTYNDAYYWNRDRITGGY